MIVDCISDGGFVAFKKLFPTLCLTKFMAACSSQGTESDNIGRGLSKASTSILSNQVLDEATSSDSNDISDPNINSPTDNTNSQAKSETEEKNHEKSSPSVFGGSTGWFLGTAGVMAAVGGIVYLAVPSSFGREDSLKKKGDAPKSDESLKPGDTPQTCTPPANTNLQDIDAAAHF